MQVTPLPNVTVYYTGYRLYSNYRALQVRQKHLYCTNSTSGTSLVRLVESPLAAFNCHASR